MIILLSSMLILKYEHIYHSRRVTFSRVFLTLPLHPLMAFIQLPLKALDYIWRILYFVITVGQKNPEHIKELVSASRVRQFAPVSKWREGLIVNVELSSMLRCISSTQGAS